MKWFHKLMNLYSIDAAYPICLYKWKKNPPLKSPDQFTPTPALYTYVLSRRHNAFTIFTHCIILSPAPHLASPPLCAEGSVGYLTPEESLLIVWKVFWIYERNSFRRLRLSSIDLECLSIHFGCLPQAANVFHKFRVSPINLHKFGASSIGFGMFP